MNVSEIQEDPQLKKLNLACGRDIQPASKNWLNVDTVDAPGVTGMDIFWLPWPFESDQFDYILAKHVLEHVPHNIPAYGFEKNFMHLLMEEVWRVLKVGGILHVISPGRLSSLVDAMDHKRFVTPETFHVFYPSDKWSYYTHCRFELVHVHRFEPRRFGIPRKLLRWLCDIDITQLRAHEIQSTLRSAAFLFGKSSSTSPGI